MSRRELLGNIVRGSIIAMLADVSNVFEGGNLMAQESEKKTVQRRSCQHTAVAIK